jgi:putative transposase
MARRARLLLPGTPLHIVQRGHNRQPCFLDRSDYLVYLDKLSEHGSTTGCAIHAYVLMTNHVHLLASFDEISGAPHLFRLLGQQYSRYLNKRLGKSGTTWEGRYWSCPVPTEQYLLTCQRYIELNPVRAGLVKQKEDYCWSSYRGNAGLAEDCMLRPHELYERLGSNDAERQQSYRRLFSQELTEAQLTEVRDGLKAATSAGLMGRPPGRPRKTQGTQYT